jgi:rhodanese-related sulfurtransferase
MACALRGDHVSQPMTSIEIDDLRIDDLRELMARNAQVVEVLPREDYEKLHLPGAISLPLAELNAETAKRLDPGRDVVVYCWDGL